MYSSIHIASFLGDFLCGSDGVGHHCVCIKMPESNMFAEVKLSWIIERLGVSIIHEIM